MNPKESPVTLFVKDPQRTYKDLLEELKHLSDTLSNLDHDAVVDEEEVRFPEQLSLGLERLAELTFLFPSLGNRSRSLSSART
jgi:hypothetical protein